MLRLSLTNPIAIGLCCHPRLLLTGRKANEHAKHLALIFRSPGCKFRLATLDWLASLLKQLISLAGLMTVNGSITSSPLEPSPHISCDWQHLDQPHSAGGERGKDAMMPLAAELAQV